VFYQESEPEWGIKSDMMNFKNRRSQAMFKNNVYKGRFAYIFTLVLIINITLFASIAFAHPPKDLKAKYNAAAKTLEVTILHPSPFPSLHYLAKVEIKKNEAAPLVFPYKNQPDQDEFTYSYTIPAADDDTLEISAYCSILGSKTIKLQISK
jgi:hypothetical protein